MHLERAFLVEAHLESARFQQAIVGPSTLIWRCCVDRHSDFRDVGLDSIRIDTGTKQLLQYNIRRINWEDWYMRQHWLTRCAVSYFWKISDYGLSTRTIIATFLKWTLVYLLKSKKIAKCGFNEPKHGYPQNPSYHLLIYDYRYLIKPP